MRILLLLLITIAAAAQTQPAAPAAGSGFVGSNACKTCHADMWLNFYKNPHFKSIATGKEPPRRRAAKDVTAGGRSTLRRAAERPPFRGRFP